MAVKWDPKVTGPLNREVAEKLLRSGDAARAKDAPAAPAPPLPERQPSTPEAPRPTPSQKAAERTPLDRRADDVSTTLRAAGDKTRAGREALAFCATYGMRRSRGARRRAVELCEEVATEAPELADVAARVRLVLLAEGALHESSGEATLKACRALVRLLQRGAGE